MKQPYGRSRWGIEPVFLRLRVLVASISSELNSM